MRLIINFGSAVWPIDDSQSLNEQEILFIHLIKWDIENVVGFLIIGETPEIY